MRKFSKFLLVTSFWTVSLLLVVGIGGFFAVWALDSFAKLSFVTGIPVVALLFVCLGLLGIRLTVTSEESSGLKMRMEQLIDAIRSAYLRVRHPRPSFETGRAREARPLPHGDGESATRRTAIPLNVSVRDEMAALKTIHSIIRSNSLTSSFTTCSFSPEINTKHASQK